MAKKFGISPGWAYELIRKIVARHPELHLEKVMLEEGDGKMHPHMALEWLEEPSAENLNKV
jgi:hypothetical protein